MRQLNNNLISIEENFNNILKKINESAGIYQKLFDLINKFNQEDILRKQIYTQMKNMFLSLQATLKKEKDLIKIDVKENYNFFFKNYSNFYNLIKKVDEAKRIYRKEEKDLVSLKNDLYKKSKIEVSSNDSVDLSKILPKNTEATLEMKKNYGFYLNKTLAEFERMNLLDDNVFKTQVIKAFKSQHNIVNIYLKDLKSIVEEINKIEENDIKNEIKEEKNKK